MEHYGRDCLFNFRSSYFLLRAGVWLLGTRAGFVRAVRICVFCQFCGSQTQIILKYGMIKLC